MKICVTGAGGMIGGALVGELLFQGHEVRAADIKPKQLWWQVHKTAQNLGEIDVSIQQAANHVARGADQIYHLAERMGGIGYITSNKILCAESIEIGIAMLRAAINEGVPRFFFSSSACIYPTHLQAFSANKFKTVGLLEDEAWPARPEEGYGFSKLFMEELCRHYHDEQGLNVRIARYHNVFGAPGSWNDGKEKAPAALCRKIAEAVASGKHEIEIWGDGKQLRSYLSMTDCIAGTIALMNSDYDKPMNIGSNRSVSVDELVSIIEQIAEVNVERHYVPGAIGVDARNADISLARDELGWKPQVSLEKGLGDLYGWIEAQVLHPSH